MKKAKTDYIKELENFSSYCLYEAENFNHTVNHQKKNEIVFHFIDELQNLTEHIKNEYFTPIEREDIFMIATSLSDLYLSLRRLNSVSSLNSFYPSEIVTLSNFLLSAIEKINEAIKMLNNIQKNDICGLLFEILKLSDKTYKYTKKIYESEQTTQLLSDCFIKCEMLARKLIGVYLKNT